MSKSIKLLIVVMLSGMFLMVAPRRAFACSCAGHGNPLYESPKADAVFAGRIIGQSWLFAPQDTIFDVSMVWKGPETSTITISGVGSLCDYPFDVNHEYLVYAYKDQNGLHASRCSRTMVTYAAQANGEFARLGPGKTIVGSHNSPNLAVWVVPIFGLLGLVTTFVVWLRRSKRRRIGA